MIYLAEDGSRRSTCSSHRTLGYYATSDYAGMTVWLCRGCDEPQAIHESAEETAARVACYPAPTYEACPRCGRTDAVTVRQATPASVVARCTSCLFVETRSLP